LTKAIERHTIRPVLGRDTLVPHSIGAASEVTSQIVFELVVTSKTIQWNKETKAEDLSTGQCSKESGHAPTVVLLLLNFLFNLEKEARYTAGTAIGTESQLEISADKNQKPCPSKGGVLVCVLAFFLFPGRVEAGQAVVPNI
jgi:hypothetical protein